MVEQDYLMRVIHEMVRAVLKVLFHLDETKEQEIKFQKRETADIYHTLQKLVEQGKINEAENLLYDSLDKGEPEGLKLALLFYDDLNTKSSEILEQHDFSREEIADGLKQAIGTYGYQGLAETLLETTE